MYCDPYWLTTANPMKSLRSFRELRSRSKYPVSSFAQVIERMLTYYRASRDTLKHDTRYMASFPVFIANTLIFQAEEGFYTRIHIELAKADVAWERPG